MKINSNGYTQANEKAIQNSYLQQMNPSKKEEKEISVEEQIQKSAVEVSLSMNAQIILFAMDSKDLASNNTKAQNAILDFLSGKEIEGDFSLKDIGYEGKPITELTQEEASELVSDEGFFGISQTSQRVANFVFNFSGEDLDILEKGREGIVQGFEEAKKMWGGELPQISYDTQTKTLELIDARIQELKALQTNQEPTQKTIEEN